MAQGYFRSTATPPNAKQIQLKDRLRFFAFDFGLEATVVKERTLEMGLRATLAYHSVQQRVDEVREVWPVFETVTRKEASLYGGAVGIRAEVYLYQEVFFLSADVGLGLFHSLMLYEDEFYQPGTATGQTRGRRYSVVNYGHLQFALGFRTQVGLSFLVGFRRAHYADLSDTMSAGYAGFVLGVGYIF